MGCLALIWRYDHKYQAAPIYGVSFSPDYATYLGLDWHETYQALLNDLKVRKFRLMSYWSEGEPTPGHYDFIDLDYQMDEAAKAGAKVTLAIGLRQPHYPECHQPAWANALSKTDRETALKAYMAAVVERYKTSPALASWQLENEALNRSFGVCDDFDRARLTRERDLVAGLDPSHPIIINVSNQFGTPWLGPIGDIVGFSVYRISYNPTFGYIGRPIPAFWHSLRAGIVDFFWHKPVIIHELQAEPWGAKGNAELSINEQNKSMDATKLTDTLHYTEATHIPQAYLWGAEWWYARKVQDNDPSVWEAARPAFK